MSTRTLESLCIATMYDSVLFYVQRRKKETLLPIWSSRCLQTNTTARPIGLNEEGERERSVYLYLCEYVENPGAINVWLARYHGSTPLEKEDVIFMIVKTSSLRNKSDEEAGVSPDQKSEWHVLAILLTPLFPLRLLPRLFRTIKPTHHYLISQGISRKVMNEKTSDLNLKNWSLFDCQTVNRDVPRVSREFEFEINLFSSKRFFLVTNDRNYLIFNIYFDNYTIRLVFASNWNL